MICMTNVPLRTLPFPPPCQMERFEYDGVRAAPKICSVYYKDGEEEHMDAHTFDQLIGKPVWRQQLILMQAYVPRLSTQRGFYSERPVVRSMIDSTGGEAADLACKVCCIDVPLSPPF